ncbi:hypothetical protein [Myxosarcina sp. GI1(2024)]
MKSKKVYLTGLAYELGDLCDIREIDDLKRSSQLLDMLLMLNLDKYSKSQLTASELAKNSILQTLEKAQVCRKDIDVVIYATNSFWNLGAGVNGTGLPEVARLIDELALEQAYPIGINLSECGNLHSALRVAASLVRAGDCENVLIVTTDKNSEEERILQGTLSVLSDGAASFLLTNSREKGEFELLCTSQYINSKASNIDPKTPEFLEETIKGVKQTANIALKKINKKPNDFRRLITNCYNISVSRTFCHILGFNEAQTYTKNISRFAHAWASDNIINLHDFSIESPLLTDELAMLIGTGSSGWGCSLLSKT